jgi:hypothetical protein
MSRKAKAPSKRRSNILPIRLTEKERTLIDTAATKEILDTSTWARIVLLRASGFDPKGDGGTTGARST